MEVLTPKGTHTIYFLSATRPDAPRGIPKIGWAYGDEVALWEEDAWRNLRLGLVDTTAPFLGTTTPRYEVGTMFLKEECDEAIKHKFNPFLPWDERKFYVNWSMHDNPYLSKKEKINVDNEYSGDWHAQEVLGKFVTGGMCLFEGLDFPGYEIDMVKPGTLEYYMTIDPAYTSEEITGRSQSSISVHGISPGKRFHFVENPVGYWSPNELINHVLTLQRKYSIRRVGVERVAGSVYIKPMLEERMRRENLHFEVVELPLVGNKDKVARAQVMVYHLKTSNFVFPMRQGKWTNDAEKAIKQFRAFPYGRLSDIVDSNAHMFHRDMRLVGGFVSSEELNEMQDFANSPMNLLTQEQVDKVLGEWDSDEYSLSVN